NPIRARRSQSWSRTPSMRTRATSSSRGGACAAVRRSPFATTARASCRVSAARRRSATSRRTSGARGSAAFAARAEARDGDGRLIRRGVTYRWSLEGTGFSVRGEGARPAVTAEAATRPGATARLRVQVEQGPRTTAAEATVEAVEPRVDEAGFGIPEPHLVDAAGETWRSRFDGRRWEVNQMHEDYLALKGEARARLRYLLALLAKDLSQHAHRVPGAVEASEDVAAILALAERNLRGA